MHVDRYRGRERQRSLIPYNPARLDSVGVSGDRHGVAHAYGGGPGQRCEGGADLRASQRAGHALHPPHLQPLTLHAW